MRFPQLFAKPFHGNTLSFILVMDARGAPRKAGSFGGAGEASYNRVNRSHAQHGYSHSPPISIAFGSFPPLPASRSGGQLPARRTGKSNADQAAAEVGHREISTAEGGIKTPVKLDMSSGSPLAPRSQTWETFSESEELGMDPQRQEPQCMSFATNPGLSQTISQFNIGLSSESDFPSLTSSSGVKRRSGVPARRQLEREENGKWEGARPTFHKPEEQVTVRSSDQAQADVSSAKPQVLAQQADNVPNVSAQTQIDDPQSKPSASVQKNTSVTRPSTYGKPEMISGRETDGKQYEQNVGNSRMGQRTPRQRDRWQDGSQYDNEADLDALGRMLTRILRHQAVKYNLKIRSDGFVDVNDILNLSLKTATKRPINSHTVKDVLQVVEQDKKKRLGLTHEEEKILIRANQGHTLEGVESEDLLKPVTSPNDVPVCVHGTFKRHVDDILKGGLKRMTRRHVHFASGEYGSKDVISGMRGSCDVLIYLNVKKALSDGMKLYISENGVILTEGFDGVVPVEYFIEMVDLKSGKRIYPKFETNG